MLTTNLLPVMAMNINKHTTGDIAAVFLFEDTIEESSILDAMETDADSLEEFTFANSVCRFSATLNTATDELGTYVSTSTTTSLLGDFGHSYSVDTDAYLNLSASESPLINIKMCAYAPKAIASRYDISSSSTYMSPPSDAQLMAAQYKPDMAYTSIDIVNALNLNSPYVTPLIRLGYGYYSGGSKTVQHIVEFVYDEPIAPDILAYKVNTLGYTHYLPWGSILLQVYYFDEVQNKWLNWMQDWIKGESVYARESPAPDVSARRWKVTMSQHLYSGSGSNSSAIYLTKFALGNRNVPATLTEKNVTRALVVPYNQLDATDLTYYYSNTPVCMLVDVANGNESISSSTSTISNKFLLASPAIEGTRMSTTTDKVYIEGDL